MKVGYELNLSQMQKLVMTPELIQAIQILQFNTQELESFVQEQLLTNPILEISPSSQPEAEKSDPDSEKADSPSEIKSENSENDSFDWSEHFKEYDDISYKQESYSQREHSDYTYEQFATSSITLVEHLLFQLQFAPIRKNHKFIGRYIIEALDQNGYLTISIEEISKKLDVSISNVENVLKAIQDFEPSGVGARDLQECLKIQLKNMELDNDLIFNIIDNHLQDIAENRLSNIAKDLNITAKEVQEIRDIIKSLEPKPGREFGDPNETRYIVPDVTVEKSEGKYVVSVNEATAPKLFVSSYYKKMLTESDKESTISKFLSGRLNSALWLIKSIEQRRQTIFNVVTAVVKYQERFFEEGPKHLKTLTLKQIADEVGIHESTVSRAINGKYLQCPRGIYEIKYFFTSGVSGGQGEGISSESIKTFIKEIVDVENPSSPSSDQTIAELLNERGIDISRRTVAKYRDDMNLPSSSKRKRY
ncbi:MAG: RNA polymerase factor sigma-54 [Eubacteriales bacterium]